MKVLFIVNLDPQKKNGLFYAVHKRILMYKKLGVDVFVINLFYEESFLISIIKKLASRSLLRVNQGSDFSFEGVKYNYYSVLISIFSMIMKVFNKFSLNKLIKNNLVESEITNFKPNIIVAHNVTATGNTARQFSIALNIPFVMVAHGSDIHTKPLKNKMEKNMVCKLLQQSNGNFFVSKHLLKKSLELGYCGGRDFIVYNGVDIENAKGLLDSYDIKRVIFVGNLIEIKNAGLLPDIFYKIKNKTNEVIEFHIVGDGVLRGTIERQMRDYGLNCIFHGQISNSESKSLIKQASLLVLPSKNEGLPIVILEALSFGVPCLASKVGGLPEVLIDKYLVDSGPDFINEFSMKAVALLSSESSVNLPKKFTWNAVVKNEVKLLMDLVG
ncbi:glycosyltransferase [Shewanella sp. 125m-7]